jgi:hypothetical protein
MEGMSNALVGTLHLSELTVPALGRKALSRGLEGLTDPCARGVSVLSLHYSQKWKTEAFFRESEMQVDESRIWLDCETDSKVLSEVYDRILTRSETPRARG